jgi:hypothetical protein
MVFLQRGRQRDGCQRYGETLIQAPLAQGVTAAYSLPRLAAFYRESLAGDGSARQDCSGTTGTQPGEPVSGHV